MPKFAQIEYFSQEGERHIQLLEITGKHGKYYHVRDPNDHRDFKIKIDDTIEITDVDPNKKPKRWD